MSTKTDRRPCDSPPAAGSASGWRDWNLRCADVALTKALEAKAKKQKGLARLYFAAAKDYVSAASGAGGPTQSDRLQ